MEAQLFVKRLTDKASLPNYATPGSAGLDLVATASLTLNAGDTRIVGTGVAVKLPLATAGFVCSRSGMAARHSVFVLNAPGVIDADYRGEIGVILHNAGRDKYEIKAGDRIAQLVIVPVEKVWVRPVDDLGDGTQRGEGGFGSTGK